MSGVLADSDSERREERGQHKPEEEEEEPRAGSGGLRIGSLFSGIGGLELGLERAGLGETVWQCEIDPWARSILARHWPGVPCHDDVRTFQPAEGSADIVCGGFPCQDLSRAGRQKGLQGARSGLWREYARVVRLVRPRYVVVENVPPLLDLGLGTVLGDLAALGYDAEWNCVPAAAVGAPHLRDRLWVLAYANGGRHLHRPPGKLPADGRQPPFLVAGPGGPAMADTVGLGREGRRGEQAGQPDAERPGQDVSNADSKRRAPQDAGAGRGVHDGDGHRSASERGRVEIESGPIGNNGTRPGATGQVANSYGVGRNGAGSQSKGWRREPSDGRIYVADADGERQLEPKGSLREVGRRIGDGRWWQVEPDVGRMAHGVPARVDRIRGLGNGVVPENAAWLGRRIAIIEAWRNAPAAV